MLLVRLCVIQFTRYSFKAFRSRRLPFIATALICYHTFKLLSRTFSKFFKIFSIFFHLVSALHLTCCLADLHKGFYTILCRKSITICSKLCTKTSPVFRRPMGILPAAQQTQNPLRRYLRSGRYILYYIEIRTRTSWRCNPSAR